MEILTNSKKKIDASWAQKMYNKTCTSLVRNQFQAKTLTANIRSLETSTWRKFE